MKTPQKQIILNYLRWKNEWTPAYALRSVNTPFGWIGFQGDRRARELAQEGKIEHKIEGAYAYYMAKPIVYQTYKVLDDNGQPYKEIKVAQIKVK